MKCNTCGLPFNESDLSQVVSHEHIDGLKVNETPKSKRVISHAREIYTTAPIQFCMGVHAYLKGQYDERLMHLESTDFKRGYWQASEDLQQDYSLQPQ